MITLRSLHIVPYALPLTAPLALGGEAVTERRGLLLYLADTEGRMAWGEAAPLPGFSREAPAQVEAAARALAGRVPGAEMARTTDAAALVGADAPASLAFGFEAAVAGLLAAARGVTLPELLAPQQSGARAASLPVSALLEAPPDAWAEAAAALWQQGWRTLKVKVGRGDPEAEAAAVLRLRRRLGPQLVLRLDANRAWDLATATRFARAIAAARVAYVEEPLRNPSELAGLTAETGLPVALDESLVGIAAEGLPGFPRAVVLKPTLLGGIERVRALAAAARQRGQAVVFSAAYESGVGLRHIAALALAFGTPGIAHGLDTARRLAADTLAPTLRPEAGRVVVDWSASVRPDLAAGA